METSSYSMYSLGSSLVQGWANRYMQKQDMRVQQGQFEHALRIGKLNNAMLDQQAQLQNAMRAGQNRLLEAQAASDNVLRQVNNKRILIRASADHEAATENFLRSQEGMVQGSLEDQIAAAEQRGAYAANSALTGTLGTTVENMEHTLRLKQNRTEQYKINQNGYATYDQLKQMAGIVPAATGALDTGVTIAALDYGTTFSQARPLNDMYVKPNIAGNFFTDGWAWALKNPDGFRQAGNTISSWFTGANVKPEGFGASVYNP